MYFDFCVGYRSSGKMEFFFRNTSDDSSGFQQDIARCPFLTNINEPTSFSFSSSVGFPIPVSCWLITYLRTSFSLASLYIACILMNRFTLVGWPRPFHTKVEVKSFSLLSLHLNQVRGGKGPIFEDGPNFDVAFRLFHGQNGAVPLSGRLSVTNEKQDSEATPRHFNPLVAKAATISLSGFGFGGPFGFDSFSEKWKNQKKKSESSKRQVRDISFLFCIDQISQHVKTAEFHCNLVYDFVKCSESSGTLYSTSWSSIE